MQTSSARSRRAWTIAQFGCAGDAGALAHYEDPSYYDKTYARRRRDVDYYLRVAEDASSVLEYGIGSGRVALALARAGVAVTGIDLSRPMLDALEARLLREPKNVRARVDARLGDMREMRLRRRFPLVIAPFNVVLHLYSRDDVHRFLGRVKEHLAPAGRFVFDWSIPVAEDLCRDPRRAYGAPPIRHPATGEVVRYAERFEYDPIRQLLLIWMEFRPYSGQPGWKVPLTHRQFFPQEMLAFLEHAGFEVELHADFRQEPPSATSDSLVATCRLRRPRKP